MEEDLQSSPQFEKSMDTDDSKHLCELSTILVANIEEIKDRISQIQFIFCSQLFPNFQSRSKYLQKRLLEAQKIAEDEWKKKENSLLHQIEDLRREKQFAQEQMHELNISLEQSKKRLMSTEQLLNKYEYDKQQLLNKLENLERNEERIAKLNEQLSQKTIEVAEGKEYQERLLQDIKLKDQALLVEQRKRKGLLEECNKFNTSYKHLKSQYNFLVGKIGDGKENKPHPDRMEEEKSSPRPYLNKRSPRDAKNKNQETNQLTSKPTELKIEDDNLQEKLESNRDIRLTKSMNASSHIIPSSRSISLPLKPIAVNAKSESSAGLKRPASFWRDTRMRQEPGGADPHDDFLDTPMEIVRNLNMDPHEELQDLPVFAPKDMDFNNSDDETQEIINPETLPQRQHTNKGFKYVEPVRKKAERENLLGVECKQCKKFYDAVLPDDNTMNGYKSMRCEHHDGVSRHRYRYAPPMTPEGFWNIGFESDL